MSEIINFEINFAKPAYYAGETLSGTVVLELNKPMQAAQLKLEISGGTYVEWEERSSTHRGSDIPYKGEEVYLNYSKILWERKDKKDTIDKGKNEYDFSVPIPANAPSSFNVGHKARISYIARVLISRDGFWQSDGVRTKPFTVVSLLDLNSTPQLNCGLQEVHAHEKISLTVLLPKSGFVLGETINLEARLANNSSSKKIEKIEATLFHNVNMKAYKNGDVHGKMHVESKEATILERYLTVDMGPNTPNRQVFMDLEIPRVSPTLKTCNILDINYTLILKLHIGGLLTNPVRVKCPIVLGTVPFREENQTASAPPVQEYNTELPPPSYSESTKISD